MNSLTHLPPVVYTLLWLVWLVAFLLIEGSAIVSKQPGATLSAHVWKWFMVKGPERNTAAAWLLRALLGAFLTWLQGHLTGQTP